MSDKTAKPTLSLEQELANANETIALLQESISDSEAEVSKVKLELISANETIEALKLKLLEPKAATNSVDATIEVGNGKVAVAPMVTFDVKYPEGFEGTRFMQEGERQMAIEIAKQFEEKGLGKIKN